MEKYHILKLEVKKCCYKTLVLKYWYKVLPSIRLFFLFFPKPQILFFCVLRVLVNITSLFLRFISCIHGLTVLVYISVPYLPRLISCIHFGQGLKYQQCHWAPFLNACKKNEKYMLKEVICFQIKGDKKPKEIR